MDIHDRIDSSRRGLARQIAQISQVAFVVVAHPAQDHDPTHGIDEVTALGLQWS
jgi:hypothetical protein